MTKSATLEPWSANGLRERSCITSLTVTSLESFRLDVLLSLQDALQEFAIAVGKVDLFDMKQLKEKSQLTQIPDDLNDGLHLALINLRRLKERITDDSTRNQINELIANSMNVVVQATTAQWPPQKISCRNR